MNIERNTNKTDTSVISEYPPGLSYSNRVQYSSSMHEKSDDPSGGVRLGDPPGGGGGSPVSSCR